MYVWLLHPAEKLINLVCPVLYVHAYSLDHHMVSIPVWKAHPPGILHLHLLLRRCSNIHFSTQHSRQYDVDLSQSLRFWGFSGFLDLHLQTTKLLGQMS